MGKYPQGVESLVDYQVRRWTAAQKEKASHHEAKIWPVVTISREYGTLGAKIAQTLADTLKWTCWDQELVNELAKHTDVSARIVATVDEHRHNVIATMLNNLVHRETLSESAYLRELVRIIHVIEHHGEGVIVGRGSHYVVSPEAALRVRIISPIDRRVRGLVARRGVSEKEARAEIIGVDAERRDFMAHHFQRDIDDPHSFDLILNVASLNVEQATAIIISAYKTRFGAPPV